jgi:DNA repair protein RadD
MSNHQEQVEKLLYKLAQFSLSRYIGVDRLDRIEEAGLTLNTELMCEVLYSIKGINIFKDKQLRYDLLATLDREVQNSIVNNDQSISEGLASFNDFNWGKNQKSKEFLRVFKLDGFEITNSSKSIESVKNVNIFKCLYPYQNWIRKEVNNFLNGVGKHKNKSKVIVQMPTGSGKTRTMLESVCDHIRNKDTTKDTIVWLAHSEELCEQAASEFENIWSKLGSESAQIVRLWGGNSPDSLSISQPTFIVTSFDTAYQMTISPKNQRFEIFNEIRVNCSLIIVDEAHQSTAPTYEAAISLLANQSTKIVGLTATPGRHGVGGKDIGTKELAKFYEHNQIPIVGDEGETLKDPIKFLTEKGVLANITRYSIDSEVDVELTPKESETMSNLLDIPNSVLKKLGASGLRNNKIVTAAIVEAQEKKFPTIIFAPSKDSAIEIALLIRLKGIDARAVVGDTPTLDRERYIKDFKKGNLNILVNFGVLTTGFDSPNIKSVIIARPTTSVVLYSQMIGRGLRGKLMGGEDHCDIIDVHDNILNMPTASEAYTFFDKYFTGDQNGN